jgi:hypothetical protein
VSRRVRSFAVVVALALGACFLPQPVPEVARTVDGGTVSIAILLAETAQPSEATVLVRPDCPAPGAQFTLSATVDDTNTDEAVEARWFVDYSPAHPTLLRVDAVNASGDPNDALRPLTPLVFTPYVFGTTVPVHVVEVVVSNNFFPLNDPTLPFNRSAPAPYVTQVYRWTFQYDPAGRCQFP